MPCPPAPVNIVVAACKNMGIGKDGGIPWRLRNELKYFAELTTKTQDSGKQNALIMGRKTFLAIPEQLRPLKNRINIMLSKEASSSSISKPGMYVMPSYEAAIDLINTELCDKVERIFIIGGSSVYAEAMRHAAGCHRIYITRILAEFDCDTFMPDFESATYEKISLPEVPIGVQSENNIDYVYEVYESRAGVH